MNNWLTARNILAVRLDNIGDVVMLGPSLRAVKDHLPDARVTLLASPSGSAGAALLPWVDDTLIWRSVWQDLGHLSFDPARELDLVAMLRERSFDAALVFTSFSQTPHVAGYVCYLAGIPLRAGATAEFGGATLTTELRGTPDALHQVERNLRLVEAVGFNARDRRLEVSIPEDARNAAARLLASVAVDAARPFVIAHPGASASARRYPAERFAEVVALLIERGQQVLVTGVEREARQIALIRKRSPLAAFLVGGASVAEYAALVERAALVICNNSLPTHLADALMTPQVVLYSGSDLESQWRPRHSPARLMRRDTACYPCYRFDCPIGLPCLDVSPVEVVDASLALLSSPKRLMPEEALA